MINLPSHHRVQIPNSLAIAAALVLVISSIVGFDSNQEAGSSERASMPTANANSVETDSISGTVENKPRGINIGSLLFRRG